MTYSIKKKIQTLIKSIGYNIFSFFFGKIRGVIYPKDDQSIKIVTSSLGVNYSYRIFKIKNCRLYTDTINDTAFIKDNKIIEGPSFQLRNVKNSHISQNIVFTKGTPRFKKKLNGAVFSLLTGGAGNSNYWHWLFDVLPRIKILENKIDIKEIDFYLFPDLKEKFQIETLDLLKIPVDKRLSSRFYRHVEITNSYSVDHPYVINNNPTNEIQNIPYWIIDYLKEKFLMNTSDKFPKKFFIDRSDAKSNHSHLRRIINEEEVKKRLIKKGFSIIKLSDLSFKDQVSLFNNATEIVGLHGAGFANLTFCKPNTFILELKPATAGFMYSNLAKQLKLNYKDISINPSVHSNNNQQGLIEIPLNNLEKKLFNFL